MQSNLKSENGFHLRENRPQGRFQLRNPNPDFMDFLFIVRLGNPKTICETILLNSGLLFANYACAYKNAVLKDSFPNPCLDFPIEQLKGNSTTDIERQKGNP